MDLHFSTNWNNKVQCEAFTTLRIYQPGKHVVGTAVHVILKGQPVCKGIIAAVKPLYLHQVNEFIAYLDTGYNTEACKSIIKKMYPSINFNQQQLALLLIVRNQPITMPKLPFTKQ